jgi:hypothetical protein
MVKSISPFSVALCTAIVLTFAMQTNSHAQILLNEIEVDTPSGISEPCEYIEVLGKPGSVVPPGIFFLSIDSDSGQYGFVDYIKDLGGVTFGSNGTITIVTSSDVCTGRKYPAGTTVVKSSSFAMGFFAETFLLAKSTRPKLLFEGQDLDVNDDGVLDSQFGLTPIDGIAWVVDPSRQKVYGGAPTIFKGSVELLPDAATRFPGDTTPFSASAWYYGEVVPPDHSTTYAGPTSSNFPRGGTLTPGAPNAGPPNSGDARRSSPQRTSRRM